MEPYREPFRLFLAHSFATERVDADPHGPADFDLAETVASWIREFSRGYIEVVRTRDPFHDYVSSGVRRDISSADGVLCLFTKRTKDHLKGLWLPSTYVVSEGSAALMQFPTEEETHRRLFGLVEEGVDPDQLGMAFHGNKTASRFRRDDLIQLEAHVRRIVDAILDERNPVPPRENREYLSIDKVASIWRSGAVWVETRHRFRFTAETATVRVSHSVWRVSESLPELDTLLNGLPGSRAGFLRVMPLHCGRHDPNRCQHRIVPQPTAWAYERNFLVEFTDLDLKPGDELAYEVVWGYPNAFHNRLAEGLDDTRPNSVGLRTSGRGVAASASLTLKFERDWAGEPSRILESHPWLFTTDINNLPGGQSPEEFFHSPEFWRFCAELKPCRKRSCTMFEVYHWTTGPFGGMAKATFLPHLNYFDFGDSSEPTDAGGTVPVGEAREEFPVRGAGI